MSIAQQTFDVLHKSLSAMRPEYAEMDVILCPMCLVGISRSVVLSNGIEHIIPRNVVKKDELEKSRLGTLNQRCGITILCRKQRHSKNNNRLLNNGCNGLKGSLYDCLFKDLFDDNSHKPSALTHRHGVAILLMGYLGAFQYFGYDYILQPELDEIREQFDFPDSRKTDWLDYVQYYLGGAETQHVATSRGLPFIVGGILTSNAPLEVYFRRCHVRLPKGHWQSKGVDSVPLLIPK